ncbi:MAG: DUF1638 domain-containing protein [Lachnospiraceae bacterium]|nr:DUF1638 domain-containing protein [Lachnospiraceae bacterium]
MKTAIVACAVMEKELQYIFSEEGLDYPIVWIESALHDVPKKLHARLEEELEKLQAERVILTFGLCGNSVIGLRADSREYILPKADDCITMLLGSRERRRKLNSELAAYYLMEGWLRGPKTPMQELQRVRERYGEKLGQEIIEVMYQNYRSLCLLDTGLSDLEQLKGECQPVAEITGTEVCVETGTLDWLRRLILGPWDSENFIVKHPGEEITEADFLC